MEKRIYLKVCTDHKILSFLHSPNYLFRNKIIVSGEV